MKIIENRKSEYNKSVTCNKFSIQVSSNNSVLVFSSVGFGTKEISVGNQTSWDAQLNSESKELGDVVMPYGGSQRKAT